MIRSDDARGLGDCPACRPTILIRLRHGIRTVLVTNSADNHRARTLQWHRVMYRMLCAAVLPFLLGLGDAACRRNSALERGEAQLTGTVQTIFGLPLCGVRVAAHTLGTLGLGPEPQGALTDDQGRFRMPVDEGRFLVEASKDDFCNGAAVVDARGGDASTVDLQLVPAAAISGRVVDFATGAGVAGAAVFADGELSVGTTVAGWRQAKSVTDASGAFTLSGLRPGTIRLTALHQTSEPTLVHLNLAEQVRDAKVYADRGYSVSGTVVSERDGHPVPNVVVEARDRQTERTILAAGPSSADGRFQVEAVPSGVYSFDTLSANVRMELGLPVTVEDSDLTDITLRFGPGVSLSGRIDPPVSASIRLEVLSSGDETMASIGRTDTVVTTVGAPHFGFTGIGRGKVGLVAQTIDGRCGRALIEVGDRDVSGIEIHLEQPSSIAGYVTDERGNPVMGASVAMSSSVLTDEGWLDLVETGRRAVDEFQRHGRSGHEFSSVLTRNDGAFASKCLLPGAYGLRVYKGGIRLRWANSAGAPRDESPLRVTVAEGGIRYDRALIVRACDGVAKGTVVESTGLPVSDVLVTAADQAADPPQGGGSALSDGMGHFSLAHLCESTTYRFVAQALHSDGEAANPAVKAGEDILLTLGRPPSIAGRVTYREQPVSNFVLSLTGPETRITRHQSADGSFLQRWMRPGTYAVTVEADTGYALQWVELGPNLAKDQPLDLTGWSSLIGSVVDEHGDPIRGLAITLFYDRAQQKERLELAWPESERLQRAFTDGEGRFRFDRVFARRGKLLFGPLGAERIVVSAESVPSVETGSVVVVPAPGKVFDLGRVRVRGLSTAGR
jgi:hypothetical protein